MNALSLLPKRLRNRLIRDLIITHLHGLKADQALRFLLDLDTFLYGLEGRKSVEYGGGLHTKHRHMRYHDFFVSRISKDEHVLDIGCGNGAVAYDVAEKAGAYVLGIDSNRSNIALANKDYSHPRITYIAGDAFEALPKRNFDVVILSNVLEHLSERPLFLRKVQELADPGRFLIRVPLFERDWRVPLKKELGIEWRLDKTHETEYTLESFDDELAAAGLKKTYQEVRWGEIWAEAARADG